MGINPNEAGNLRWIPNKNEEEIIKELETWIQSKEYSELLKDDIRKWEINKD